MTQPIYVVVYVCVYVSRHTHIPYIWLCLPKFSIWRLWLQLTSRNYSFLDFRHKDIKVSIFNFSQTQTFYPTNGKWGIKCAKEEYCFEKFFILSSQWQFTAVLYFLCWKLFFVMLSFVFFYSGSSTSDLKIKFFLLDSSLYSQCSLIKHNSNKPMKTLTGPT